MTLTRSFDLSGLQKASLEAWLWYDIEEGWDYAYVEASTDGGKTWQILVAEGSTTTDNPKVLSGAKGSGNSFGPGYTGQSRAAESLHLFAGAESLHLFAEDAADSGSGDQVSAAWIHEIFDLSPFAGRPILVRFEYLTDDAVNGPGLCIDDITIPELGYRDDIENGDGGWTARGFIRSDNTLRQPYIVQVVRVVSAADGQEVVIVDRVPLSQSAAVVGQGVEQVGSITLRGLDESTRRVALVISALAPSTTAVAPYRYRISPVD